MALEPQGNARAGGWQRHLRDADRILPGASVDNLAARYTCLADDGAQSKAKREASILASASEKHLVEGQDYKEALKTATEAVAKCYEIGDNDAMADMLRLVIKAYLLQAGLARDAKASGASGIIGAAHKKAEQIAQGELALFRNKGSVRGQAAMLLSSADILLDKRASGQPAALALQAAQEARTLYQKLGDRKMEAMSLLTIVAAHGATRHKQEALDCAQQALAAFRELGDKPNQAKALHAVAQARVTSDSFGTYSEALQVAKDALALYEELDDKRQQAQQLLSIAGMNLEREAPEQAIPPAKQAIQLFRQIGRDAGAQTAAVSTLVQAHQAMDEDSAALNTATEGLAWSQNSGDKMQEVLMHDLLAHTHLKNDDVDAAISSVKEGLAITTEVQDKESEARLKLTMCQALVKQSNTNAALKSVNEAIALLKSMGGMDRDLGTAYHMQADVLCMTEDLEGAMEAAVNAQESFLEAEDINGQGTVQLLIAGLSGASTEAISTATGALELFKRAGETRLEGLALNALVDINMACKDFDKALDLATVRRNLLQEAGYRREEARSLHSIAAVYLAKGDATSALKTAKEGMKMARSEADKLAEVHMAIQAVHASCIIAGDAQEGSKLATSTLDDATKIARDAVALAKKFGRGRMNAPALYWQGQVMQLAGSPDTMATASSAVSAFQREGDVLGEAHANVLLAMANISGGNRPKATELLQLSMRTFMQKQSQEGLAMVQSLMMAMQPQGMMMPGMGGMMPMMPQGGGGFKIVRKGPEPNEVKNKIRQLVGEALSSDEVPLDTPLMDSGLDSLASVSFRNEVSKSFNTTLPASLIFDYPTITSLTSYLVDSLTVEVKEPIAMDMPQMDMSQFMMPMMQMMPMDGGGQYASAAQPVVKKVDPVQVKNKIRQLVGEALEADTISMDTPLMDSGLDSLASVSFRNEVAKEFNTTLPASLIFDYPTTSSLTGYVVDLLMEQ